MSFLVNLIIFLIEAELIISISVAILTSAIRAEMGDHSVLKNLGVGFLYGLVPGANVIMLAKAISQLYDLYEDKANSNNN